jgi:NADP-dependent 3-hydroxy acid dehydrogenase YdfG
MPGATYTASWDGTELPQERFMKAEDIAQSLWDIYQLSQQTVVEEIVLRPQLGDI